MLYEVTSQYIIVPYLIAAQPHHEFSLWRSTLMRLILIINDQVRRQYLHSDGSNSLEPPQDFMTKKQAQMSLKVKRDEAAGPLILNNILVFRKQDADKQSDKWSAEVNSNRPVKKLEGSRKSIKKKPAVILIEKFSTTNRTDWHEQMQAGCQIWINHLTGEVSNVCPWSHHRDDSESQILADRDHRGTGSVVYDGTEFGKFMDDLDILADRRNRKEVFAKSRNQK